MKPRIESSNADGSGRLTLVDTDLGTPNSLTADVTTYELCWTDAGAPAMGRRRRPAVKPKIGSK
jgi:hypothetical protein